MVQRIESVEDLITGLQGKEKVIMQRLRSLIMEAEPRLQEKLSYGVPLFFRNRRICFLWPASFSACTLKPVPENFSVTLAMCYGNRLSNDQGLLHQDKNSKTFTITFSSLSGINERSVQEVIREAVLVDEEFGNYKKKS